MPNILLCSQKQLLKQYQNTQKGVRYKSTRLDLDLQSNIKSKQN